MGEKLLPCPFCGGEAKIVSEFNYIHNRIEYMVRCKAINCILRPKTEFHEAKEEAIKHWNTRQQMQDVPDTNVGNNGWIPVSERLPNEEEMKQAYCRNHYGSEFIVMIEGANRPTTLYRTMDGFWVDDKREIYSVVAWQPLPEAYIGENNE